MSKSLMVTIDPEIFDQLQRREYVLCLAKMVNNDYTVVWQSKTGSKLFRNNEFTWTPRYQVFASNDFVGGVTAHSFTDGRTIQGGQSCLLTDTGRMLPAQGPVDPSSPLTINNEFGSHPGINGEMNGVFTPLYVDRLGAIKGTVELTPVEKVQVWFGRNLTTSTMISSVTGVSITLDYTGLSSHSIRYTDAQTWTQESFDHNAILMMPSGKLESAVLSEGVLEYIVRFSPVIKESIRAGLIAFMTHQLLQYGTPPSNIQFSADGFNLNITFPVQTAAKHLLTRCEVPDYPREIEDILNAAVNADKLPEHEKWNIKSVVQDTQKKRAVNLGYTFTTRTRQILTPVHSVEHKTHSVQHKTHCDM